MVEYWRHVIPLHERLKKWNQPCNPHKLWVKVAYKKRTVFGTTAGCEKISCKPPALCTKNPSFFYVPKNLLLLSYWYNCPWYWPTVENRCQDLFWRVFHSNSISVTALKWSNIGRQNPKSLERGFSFVATKAITQRKFSGDSINFPYFGVCTRLCHQL